MILLATILFTGFGPIAIDIAAISPANASELSGQLVMNRPSLGPDIGNFDGRDGYDHVSPDVLCRTVWVPEGTKVDGWLVGRVGVIRHRPAGQFKGFVEVRFEGLASQDTNILE